MKRELIWFLVACGAIGAVVVGVDVEWRRYLHGDSTDENQGPDYSQVPATWVGREACLECHAAEDALWQGSDHDRAMQLPGPDTITADFSGATFDHFGVISTFYREGDRYLVRTDGPDGSLTDFEIAYVFGYDPLEQFLIRFPDGRYQCLNVCWDTRPQEEGGQRWFHLYPDDPTPASDLFHWTGMLQTWNYMCADCHSTHLQRNYDASTNTYATTYDEIDVSCEACHGPASRHIMWERAEARGLRPRDETGTRGMVVDLASPDQGVWVFEEGKATAVRTEPLASRVEVEHCGRCHARRSTLTTEYTYGKEFLDNHRLTLLEEYLYHADGQNQDEVYVYGSFLQSKMYAAGVTCSDCHEVHTGKTLGEANQVCARCHRAEVYDTYDHHFHQMGKGGDSCLDCHQQSRNLMVVDGRRDHSFRIPRPDLSLEIGTPNACSDCHQDRSVPWAQDAVVKWYGVERQQGAHYAVALQAGRSGSPGALERLRYLVSAQDQPAIARATALSLVPAYAVASEVPEVVAALEDASALVRGAAVRALESSPPERRLQLARPLLDDPVLDVQLAAARILSNIPRPVVQRGDKTRDRAREIWWSYLAENLERPETLMEVAAFHLADEEIGLAEEAYRQARKIEPRYAAPYLNHADLLRRTARPQQAMALLDEGIWKATGIAPLHHSRGLLKVSSGDRNGALEDLGLAVELEPEAARFAYVLAVALHDLGRPEESLDVLEKSLEQNPWSLEGLQALYMYAMEAGQPDRALEPAQRLVDLLPQEPGARQALETVRRELE